MGGKRVFMYFTIQSNLALALISAIGAGILLKGKPFSRRWQVIQLVGAVAITLTGVVFCVVLAPTLRRFAWNLPNLLTHVVVPVLSVADLFLCAVDPPLQRRDVLFVALPPLAYALFAGIGYVAGWEFAPGVHYPYFFLNWGSPAGAFGFSGQLPFMGVVWWILLLSCFLFGVGFLYIRILRVICEKWRPKKDGH